MASRGRGPGFWRHPREHSENAKRGHRDRYRAVHDHGDRYLIEGTPAPIGIRARSQEEAQHRAKELEEADQGRFVVLVEGVRIRGYDAPQRAQAAAERSVEVGCRNVRVLDRETGKARRIKRGA